MKHRIATKLIFILISTLAVLFILLSYILIQREIKSGEHTITENAKAFTRLSSNDLIKNYKLYYESGFYKLTDLINELFAENTDLEQILIYNMTGEIVFDSNEVKIGKYSELNKVAVRTAQDIDISAIRSKDKMAKYTTRNGVRNYDIIYPIIDDWGSHFYTVEYRFSFFSLNAQTRETIITLASLTTTFCLLIIFIIFLFSNHIIVRPLQIISRATNEFSAGKLDQNIALDSDDEIGDLAHTFNRMITDLKKSRMELENYAKNLEIEIKERTAELEQKNIEQEVINSKLNQMNKLMVGRELKMIELKKEIEKLKNPPTV